MYLLDTDTLSNALTIERSYNALRARMVGEDPAAIYISIVSVEEVIQGGLARINTARSKGRPENLITAYDLVGRLFLSLQRFQVLPYDAAAERHYLQIESAVRRKHGLDCRIAAIAAANGFTVITDNLAHFQKIGIAPCRLDARLGIAVAGDGRGELVAHTIRTGGLQKTRRIPKCETKTPGGGLIMGVGVYGHG